MATIGSLTGSTSNSIGSYGTSVRGYGGLASGLDTDSLIQGMTMGTRSKIASLLNKKQTCQWQTAAYRSVSDKLIEFKKKYISGESGPSRPSFFDRNLAAANGANSKYLDIKGASDVLENMTVVGIKSLAKDTTMTTNGAASDKLLTTGDIAIGESTYVPRLEGENIKITYGTTTYTLNMKSGQEYKYKDADGKEQTFVTDYTTPQKAVDSLNKIMENTELKIGGKLSDKVKVSLEGGKMTFKSNAGETNDVIIGGGSAAGLKLLGLMGSDDKLVNDGVITETGLSGTAVLDDAAMMREVSFGERIGGKTISFSLNGSKRDITMPDQATVESWGKDLTKMQDHIQEQMNTAFGKDKVTVAVTGKGLSFKTKDD
ncbi:MAG: flagellar cap protein FliD N-terminal domain-containing protein, partial [Hungatella sp.]